VADCWWAEIVAEVEAGLKYCSMFPLKLGLRKAWQK
jgi:hypothetical protein